MYITAIEASMYGLIDDIITLIVDDEHWIERAKIVALLVIHTLFRPLQPSEHLKRENSLSLRKISGEGKLAEHKTFLGWYIHDHSLGVFLPKQRQTAWYTDIKEALASTKIKTDTLESLIRELNHTSHAIPTSRYFLNQLRHFLKRGK